MLSQSVNAVKGESAAATLFYFLQMSLDKLKADPTHKEQFIQDYLAASEYAYAASAAETNEVKKKAYMCIKDDFFSFFSQIPCDQDSNTHSKLCHNEGDKI